MTENFKTWRCAIGYRMADSQSYLRISKGYFMMLPGLFQHDMQPSRFYVEKLYSKIKTVYYYEVIE